MRPDFRTFQYLSRAKILIHHGDRTDRKDQIDKKQAYGLCLITLIVCVVFFSTPICQIDTGVTSFSHQFDFMTSSITYRLATLTKDGATLLLQLMDIQNVCKNTCLSPNKS